ncbi:MAG: 23S rRNA (adenine(2030)-N(6))-methyltransferase RlmJ [Alphaproteobacteria bacterium]|nr:23S rRNA (adenine(2030)-N(6))-methyltransferase RlmJ [Alphaproteobacteria bacterium]
MNYRHAFHAGNFADLVKHAALLWLLAQMQRGGAPLQVIDTHGGSGLYDLRGPEARRSGEAEAGVMRLMAQAEPGAEMAPLVQAVGEANSGGETWLYPGSPWLIARTLRPGDTYDVFEMQPDEHARLSTLMTDRKGVATHGADGFAGAVGRLAPGARHLVLVDPPFERADDYARSCDLAAESLARDPAATLLIWLPLKDLHTLDVFVRDLEDACEPAPILIAEARMRPLEDPMKMNGCALALINPPEGAQAVLQAICAAVVAEAPGGKAQVWPAG